MIVSLDDFDIILGNDFFVKAKVALISHLEGVPISKQKEPYFIPALSIDEGDGKAEIVSALQLEKT